MAGTKIGGMKAAATNKAKHGPDFYAKIGAKGGANGHTGGFAANPKLASIVGAKGGQKSRRGAAVSDELFINTYMASTSYEEAAFKLKYKKVASVTVRAKRLNLPPLGQTVEVEYGTHAA